MQNRRPRSKMFSCYLSACTGSTQKSFVTISSFVGFLRQMVSAETSVGDQQVTISRYQLGLRSTTGSRMQQITWVHINLVGQIVHLWLGR